MAELSETGEQVFAVLDEIGRRRTNTRLLEDGRLVIASATPATTTVPLRTLMGVGV